MVTDMLPGFWGAIKTLRFTAHFEFEGKASSSFFFANLDGSRFD